MRHYISLLFLFLTFTFSNFSYSQSDEIKVLIDDAKNGSKSAFYNLGVRYSEGNGVKQSKEIANQYYEESAQRNYAPAQNNLGWSYRQGLGVEKNIALAIYWFRLSALQNNALALQNLAEMYQAGEGVVKNLQVAEDLYTLCATQTVINEFSGRESGFNNAILECRRELGKMISLRSKDKQSAMKLASFWFRTSLVDNKETKIDSEIGVRARRASAETYKLYELVEKKLTPESKKWVEDSLKNWNETRLYILDTTAFPLTVMDCSPEKMKL